MAGYILLGKDLRTERRFMRLVRNVIALQHPGTCNPDVLTYAHAETQCLGALAKLWMHADTYIRPDDVLDMSVDEIDQLVGIAGFCNLLPADWLQVIDSDHVQLTDFLEHNGTEAKKKAAGARRQERFRTRHRGELNDAPALEDKARCNGTALPSHPFPSLPSEEEIPNGISRPPKRTRERAGYETEEFHQRIIAAYHEKLPELPAVKIWGKNRASALNARIRERLKQGKGADQLDYWQKLFIQVAASDFLCGRAKPDFRADLEWLLRPENFAKVIEGRYNQVANGR